MKEHKKNITETIYSGDTVKFSYPDVQHIEIRGINNSANRKSAFIITRHTKYNTTIDDWENAIFIPSSELDKVLSGWSRYISERDANILKDITPEGE